jgi:hypothetical protein
MGAQIFYVATCLKIPYLMKQNNYLSYYQHDIKAQIKWPLLSLKTKKIEYGSDPDN